MLDELIEAFLLHRESEGKSAKTLKWHKGNLRLFSNWIKENSFGEDPNQWDATLIRRYLVHLRTRASANGAPLSGYSVRSYGTSVRAFCRWLEQEEFSKTNAAERVVLPKTPILVKQPFSREEVKRLLAAAGKDKRNGVRDVAVLYFLLDTGCRAAEVVSLKADDIIWQQRLAKVYGKGSKERVVFFSAETMKAMMKYRMVRGADCATFFQTEESRQLTPAGLAHITKRLAVRAGVDDVHPHRFRHTFSIEFLRAGGNVLALQRILGHTSLAVTQQYLAMVSDDLQAEHRDHSPVNRLMSRD